MIKVWKIHCDNTKELILVAFIEIRPVNRQKHKMVTSKDACDESSLKKKTPKGKGKECVCIRALKVSSNLPNRKILLSHFHLLNFCLNTDSLSGWPVLARAHTRI